MVGIILIREPWEAGVPSSSWSNVDVTVQSNIVYAGNYAAVAADTKSARITVNSSSLYAEGRFAISARPSYVVTLLQFNIFGTPITQISLMINSNGMLQLWTDIGGSRSWFYDLDMMPNTYHKIALLVDASGTHVYVEDVEVLTVPTLVPPQPMGEVAFGQRWSTSGINVYMDELYAATELLQVYWTLNVLAGLGGSVSHSTLTGAAGTATPLITASADSGYQLVHWLFDGATVYLENPLSLVINDVSTHTLQAVFEVLPPLVYQTPFTVELDPGTYVLTATYQGQTIQREAVITAGATTTVTFDFSVPIIMYNVTGQVQDSAGAPLAEVTVSSKGTSYSTTSQANGSFTLPLPAGTHTIVFQKLGYMPVESQPVNVAADMEFPDPVTLSPTPNALILVAVPLTVATVLLWGVKK